MTDGHRRLAGDVLGISPPPQEFLWQTHVRGLIGHLVLGVAIEAAFDIVDLAADLT